GADQQWQGFHRQASSRRVNEWIGSIVAVTRHGQPVPECMVVTPSGSLLLELPRQREVRAPAPPTGPIPASARRPAGGISMAGETTRSAASATDLRHTPATCPARCPHPPPAGSPIAHDGGCPRDARPT